MPLLATNNDTMPTASATTTLAASSSLDATVDNAADDATMPTVSAAAILVDSPSPAVTVDAADGATATAAPIEEPTITSPRRRGRKRSRPNAARAYSRMAANNAAHSETSTPALGDHMYDEDDDGP